MEVLDLSHREELEKAFRSLDIGLSEYSFANLYLFRKVHDYRLLRHAGELFIKGKTYDGKLFLMPTKKLEWSRYQSLVQHEVDFFFPIPEEWLPSFDSERFTSSFLERDSDYDYEVATLSTYQGLSKKRNLARQFIDAYTPATSLLLNAETKPLAKKVLDLWAKNESDEKDYDACLEAIDLVETLSLEGRVYLVGTTPVGLLIGEGIGSHTFVLHFAKADLQYKGIYQHLYQEFAKTLVGRYEWLNMEQDLGSPTLQHAKHSYHPAKMVKKWRVRA